MKYINYLLTLSLVALLPACHTTMYGKADTFGVSNSMAAYSSGTDENPRFGSGTQLSKLKAPHEQTYFFGFDRSQVHQQDLESIKAQARYLASHPKTRIVLEGNTDERGSREYNVALGERRADRVSDILIVEGVSDKQIRIVSYGQEKPAALGHNESAWHLNRRVNLKYENIG